MIRRQEPELLPTADHSAWQDSWNADEKLLAHTPSGYWGVLIDIALIKRTLEDEMTPALRLRFLQVLNRLTYGHLTLQALQRIEPCCDVALQMLAEMRKLSVEDQAELMMRWNVAASFINLNLSIIESIKLFDHTGQQQRST
jgi:hypothetical protein